MMLTKQILFLAFLILVLADLPTKTTLKIVDKNPGFELQCKNSASGAKDELKFELIPEDNGVDARFEFKSDTDSIKIATKFRVKLYNIVEYIDTNGNGYFDDGDTVIQTYELSPNGKDDWRSDQRTITVGSADCQVFQVQTLDGVFTIIGYYGPEAMTVTDLGHTYNLNPGIVEFVYTIEDFPYAALSTRLALQARFKSKSSLKEKTEDSSASKNGVSTTLEIDGSTKTISAGYEWVDSAEAGNQTIRVLTSPLRAVNASQKESGLDENESRLYFSFDSDAQPTHIEWDPTFGATSSAVICSSSLLLIAGLFVAFFN